MLIKLQNGNMKAVKQLLLLYPDADSITLSIKEFEELIEKEVTDKNILKCARALMSTMMVIQDEDKENKRCSWNSPVFSDVQIGDDEVTFRVNHMFKTLVSKLNQVGVNISKYLTIENIHTKALYILISSTKNDSIYLNGANEIREKLIAPETMPPSTFTQNIFKPATEELKNKHLVKSITYRLSYDDSKVNGPINGIEFIVER